MSLPKNVSEDLKNSGLDEKDAKLLQIEATDKGYKIPYFGLAGNVVNFYREKLIPARESFAGTQKYSQPPKTPPQFYLPPYLNWQELASATGPDAPALWITEGEKKSAKACKEGIPCIGLGGVWNWRTKAGLIKDFTDFKWSRDVIICFDSDAKRNPDILLAQYQLARTLLKMGAKVKILQLPDLRGKKTGLDDYLLDHDVEELYDIGPNEFEISEKLWSLNNQFAVIDNPPGIWSFESHRYVRKPDWEILLANQMIPNPSGKGKPESMSNMWLRWECRRSYKGVEYSPGKAPTYDRILNLWSRWGVKPEEGDTVLWHKLLEYLIPKPELRQWFEQWLAYPLQHPGAKLYTAVLVWGLHKGTGKSLIGYTMKHIYGENWTKIKNKELTSDFTEWMDKKQFILGEEISSTDKRVEADDIKDLITGDFSLINEKFQPRYMIKNCANFYFTSNHPDAIFIESDDERRFFVHEVKSPPLDEGFYKKYDAWLNSGKAGPALFYYLLYKVDTSKFNPKAPAMATESKKAMVDLSRTDLERWTHELRNHPDSVLQMDGKIIPKDVYTVSELLKMYDPYGHKNVSSTAMGKALRKAGFDTAYKLKLSNHVVASVLAVRDIAKYREASSVIWRQGYEK